MGFKGNQVLSLHVMQGGSLVDEINIKLEKLRPREWHHLCITHTKRTIRRSQLHCFLDGEMYHAPGPVSTLLLQAFPVIPILSVVIFLNTIKIYIIPGSLHLKYPLLYGSKTQPITSVLGGGIHGQVEALLWFNHPVKSRKDKIIWHIIRHI